mgnify:CR=1 FL=1
MFFVTILVGNSMRRSQSHTSRAMRGTSFLKYVCAWGVAGWAIDMLLRRLPALRAARKYADSVGKPMLNVGAGTWGSWLVGPLLGGDINCDISASIEAECAPGTVCYCDATDLSKYPDKHFGSLVALHILEHLDNPDAALKEWNRVADKVFIVVPRWWSALAFTHPGHMWYFYGGDPAGAKIRLRRKMSFFPSLG